MSEVKVAKGLLYTDDHEWVKVDGDKAYVGISDYAAHHLGDIVFVELPEVDSEVSLGDSIGVIESVKAVASVYSPISGTVVEANEELEASPEALNEDCYENWIAVITIGDSSELDKLMDDAAYEEFCANIEE